ncbi:hypothetical protein MJO29_004252, partial [Puccinia striiformis f. sp. tritici]
GGQLGALESEMQNSSNPLIPKSFPLENQSPSNHSSLPDAEYETDDWDGEYKIDENDGEYKTDDPDAEYETDDPDGEYKIDENDDLSNRLVTLLFEPLCYEQNNQDTAYIQSQSKVIDFGTQQIVVFIFLVFSH